jgi:hypothetical protein
VMHSMSRCDVQHMAKKPISVQLKREQLIMLIREGAGAVQTRLYNESFPARGDLIEDLRELLWLATKLPERSKK